MFTPGSNVKWWLLWAAGPYAVVARLRGWLYQRGWFRQRKLPVPVISVGNLTVGGVGKTPVVIRLAEWLSAEGKRIAILSRGYRRTSGERIVLVSDGAGTLAGPQEAGDEPHLIARRCPQAIVAVGPDRYEVGRWVLQRFPIDCILLDDGFQHLGLYRDMNLLLVDATDSTGLEAVVPAGRLREPVGAAARAGMILVTRAEDQRQVEKVLHRLPAIPQTADPVRVVFRAEGVVSVTTSVLHPCQWCQGKTAVLCSGVANADSFRSTAQSAGFTVVEDLVYQDHHHYTVDDVNRVRAAAAARRADVVVTTEKDAGKLAPLLTPSDSNWWAIRLGVDIAAGEQRLRESILKCLRRSPVEVCA